MFILYFHELSFQQMSFISSSVQEDLLRYFLGNKKVPVPFQEQVLIFRNKKEHLPR